MTIQTIGILGAGQLGKMLAEAARELGYKTHIYAPDADPIAASVADYFTKAEYTDIAALQAFANSVEVITLEFENVPVEPLKTLTTPIHPSVAVLELSQHRVREKMLATSLGIATAPFAAIENEKDLQEAIDIIGTPGILKTCTMGYDGKGQRKISTHEDIDNLLHKDSGFRIQTSEKSSTESRTLNTESYIYEGFVDFRKEISVIVARSAAGEVQCFEPVENVHKNHVLYTTTVPAKISPELTKRAIDVATTLANALNVIGLLAVEMFVSNEGEILLNEIAPRPHNSGHWTLDGCNVSQFEQAIRAVTNMPLIMPERMYESIVMTNLIGDDINHLEGWKNKGAHIHIYGKKEVRAGRKMGHVTELQS